MNKFLKLYDGSFPVNELKIKDNYIDKTYITVPIRKSIKDIHKLQTLYAKWT